MARGEADKFETWLGAIINPKEAFFLVVKSVNEVDMIFERVAKIGYEKQIKAVVTLSDDVPGDSESFDIEDFRENNKEYTIVDIRNTAEVAGGKIFEDALTIPLNELRERAGEIPATKPVVVHCAGGYRSAAGSSILQNKFDKVKVFDLSDKIKEFN